MPALASSTSTRRSISASTESSLGVTRSFFQVGRHGLEPEHCPLVERAGEQPQLDLVERVERPAPMFDYPAAALDRILDPLQRDECIDAAKRPQRHRRTLRLLARWLRQA